jgi:hypothetical protein
VLFLSLSNCDKEAEVQPKEYPYVITNSPIVNNEGVKFLADLKNLGTQEILKYGFVWGKNSNPTIQNNNRLFFEEPSKGIYSCNINSGLAKEQTYYVRAYILTDQYEVYGNEKLFKSQGSLPPEINSFSPQKGYAGERVTIEGRNFSNNKDNIVVKFGEVNAIIDSLSNDVVYVKSPLIKKSGKIKISILISGMEAISTNDYEVFYSWIEKGNYPGAGVHSSAYFSINNYGYMIGGQEYNSNEFTNGPFCQNLWRYNPGDNSWKKMNDLPFIPYYRTGTFIIDDIGYVYSSSRNAKAFYKYNVENDSWTKETEYPGNGEWFTTIVINNEVYVGLGTDNYNLYDEFFKYNPFSKEWNRCAKFPGPSRYNALGFSINGKGYIALGQDYYNYYNDVWEYNPETDKWIRKNDFSGKERSMSVCFSIKGKIYLGLGTKDENYQGYSDIWEYQQESDTWQEKDSYIGQAKWNNIVFTFNDKAYIGTGAKSYGGGSSWSIWRSYKDLWEFNPNLK